MTTEDLKTEVINLGFDSQIENTDCFVSSVNRALNIIYTDRPVSQTVRIFVDTPVVLQKHELIVHKPGDRIEIPITGGCLSFRSTGNGDCYIYNGTRTILMPLSGNNQLMRRELTEPCVITFQGENYFTVNNFAVFEYPLGSGFSYIPEYGSFREISLKDYCHNFKSIATEPMDANGNPIKSLIIRHGTMQVPFEFKGEIQLTYYRNPSQISYALYSQIVDIPNECAHLLPLLTASFMWLDDDAGKAQYYMSLYRDAMANIRRYSTNQVDTEYRVNGWA